MSNEIYIETARKIINLEINSREDITRQQFIKKMAEANFEDFIASETTVWRYLNGNKDAGKQQHSFLSSSMLILEISLVEMYEMVDIYLTMDEETITVDKYKSEIRGAVFVYNRLINIYRTHDKYREDRLTLDRLLDENLFKVLDVLQEINKDNQNSIIILYNNFSGFTSQMKLFWEIAIKKSCDDSKYIFKIKKKINNKKVIYKKIELNQDLKILFDIKMNQKTSQVSENNLLIELQDIKKIKNYSDVENHNDKNKYECKINGEWLSCIVNYYGYEEKNKENFLDTAYKYSLLSKKEMKKLMSE